MPSEAIGRIRLGRGRQTAIDRLAKEILAASPDLTPAQATAQARAELEGQNLGIEGLGAGGASRLPQELRQELESVGGGQEVGDDPAPPTSILSYEADSSEDAINVPPAPIGERRSIDIPPAPETAGRGDQVARILEVLGGVGAGIGERRSIGKANKLTAQRQALSNLVNTLRGSATTGVAREEPRAGLLQTLGEGIGAGAKSFRVGRGLGREERNIAARQEFVDERLLREDERAQAQRDRLAGFREREVSIKESTAAAKRPPAARAPITQVFPDKSLRQWDEVRKEWITIGDGSPPSTNAPTTRNFSDGTTRQWDAEEETWDIITEKPLTERGDRTSATGLSMIVEAQSFRAELDALDNLLKDVYFTGAGSRALNTFLGIDFLPDIPEGGGRPNFGFLEGFIADTFPGDSRFAARLERLTVSFARMANGGRPSDPDRFATMFDLPIKSESRDTQQAKINALKEMSEWREILLRNNFNVPVAGYLQRGKDGIMRLNVNKLQTDMDNRFLTADVRSWLEADLADPETPADRKTEIQALLAGDQGSKEDDPESVNVDVEFN